MNIFDILANNLQCVYQTCQGNDSGTVLVIVEDRNVADFFELALDVEALRSFNVLEVYAAKGWLHQLDSLDDFVWVFGIQTDWESIYACKGFEQNGFTFHNRHTSACADIAQTQYSSTVGYNSNQVAFCCIFINVIVIFVDLETWLSNTWGVSQRKVLCTVERNLALYAQFALCFSVHFKGFFINVHFGNPPYYSIVIFDFTFLRQKLPPGERCLPCESSLHGHTPSRQKLDTFILLFLSKSAQ